MLKLGLSERGLIQLHCLFDAAEQRCEGLRRELAARGELEAAAHQAKRRDEYAEMKRRILTELRSAMPPSRLRRLAQLMLGTWRHMRTMWRYYYFPQRP